jgi:hypothetical protein
LIIPHETITVSENLVAGRENIAAVRLNGSAVIDPEMESQTVIVDRIDRDPSSPGLFGIRDGDNYAIRKVGTVGSTFVSVPITPSDKGFDVINRAQIVGRVVTIFSKMRHGVRPLPTQGD